MRKSIIAAFIFALFLVTFVFFLFRGTYWNGSSRFRLVLADPDGGVTIALIDPKRNELQPFRINGDLQTETAYGYGKFKVSSLWKLGEQEKKGGGNMVARTLIKGLGVPVEGFLSYGDSVSAFPLARGMLFATETNVSLIDRLRFVWFSLNSRILDMKDLSPDNTIILGEEIAKLSDGIVTLSYTTELSDTQVRSLNTLVSNLGGKILDISINQEKLSYTCEVKGPSLFSHKLARILNCHYVKTDTEGVTLIVGEEFAKNY